MFKTQKNETSNKIPTLIVLVGLSGSGKSTKAENFQRSLDAVLVSTDKIRSIICPEGMSDQSKNEEVFKLFHKTINYNLQRGNSVVADATNLTIKSRAQILQLTKNIVCHKVAYVMNVPYLECLVNNSARARQVPEDVIDRQMGKFQIPFYEEGFDHITFHRWDKKNYLLNHEGIIQLNKSIYNFDQKTPYHDYCLGEHMFKAFQKFRDEYKPNKNLLMGALMHDMGKPLTQTFDENGIAHYYDHANVGAYYFITHFAEIDLIKNVLETVFLINYHMLPFNWKMPKTHKKYKKIFGINNYNMLINFNRCDKAATKEQGET